MTTESPKTTLRDEQQIQEEPGYGFEQRKMRLSKIALCKDFENMTDPQVVLRIFCERGNYKSHYHWDLFQDSIMIFCEISYFMNGRDFMVIKKSMMFPGTSLHTAKVTVAREILIELGIWRAHPLIIPHPSPIPHPQQHPIPPPQPPVKKINTTELAAQVSQLVTSFVENAK